MVGEQRLTWVAAFVACGVAAVAPATAGAQVPGVPCLQLLPGVGTSCTAPAPAPKDGSASQAQSATAVKRQFSATSTPNLARALAAEVNRIRRAHKLRPLAFSTHLTSAGTAHAHALAASGQFTHAWPTTGRLFGSWIRGYYPSRGFRSWSAGENLLWASPGFTPASAVQQWLDSPMHRRVMLSRGWRELGIGVVSAAAAPGQFGERDVQIAAAEFGVRRR
jgi:uncharacterized protein YkwD